LETKGSADTRCLFSHKCGRRSHDLGARLAEALRPGGVELLVDPFRYGDDFGARMRTFEFDALLFLLSRASWASPACQVELETARVRGAPVFVAHTGGFPIPEELKGRYALNLRGSGGDPSPAAVARLAEAVIARATLQRRLKSLVAAAPPDVTRAAAEAVAFDSDRTALAERAAELALKYRELEDPITCFFISQALGEAGTQEAAALLRSLPTKGHPYPNDGVRQALELISRAE
jgi:hypothetical protein